MTYAEAWKDMTEGRTLDPIRHGFGMVEFGGSLYMTINLNPTLIDSKNGETWGWPAVNYLMERVTIVYHFSEDEITDDGEDKDAGEYDWDRDHIEKVEKLIT